MATTVNIPALNNLPEAQLHHLPCNIRSNEEANVDGYFNPQEKEEAGGKKTLSSTFRGRPLDGEVLKVPEGYSGILVDEKRKPFSEDEDRTLDVIGKFDKFTKWHLDSKYTSDSTIDKAMKLWPSISAAIHSPVEPERSDTKVET